MLAERRANDPQWKAVEDDFCRAYQALRRCVVESIEAGRKPPLLSVSALARAAERGRTALYQRHGHWVTRVIRTQRAAERLWDRRCRRARVSEAESPERLKLRIADLERALADAQAARATEELVALLGVVTDRSTQRRQRDETELRHRLEAVTRERDEIRARYDALLDSVAYAASPSADGAPPSTTGATESRHDVPGGGFAGGRARRRAAVERAG